MIASRVTRVLVDTQIPRMLVRSNLSSGKGKGSSSPRDGCFKCVGARFSTRLQCTQKHRQDIVWQKANRASHVPRARAKARVKKTRENPRESKGPKGAKGSHKGKTTKKLVSRVLTTGNLHRHVPLTLPMSRS